MEKSISSSSNQTAPTKYWVHIDGQHFYIKNALKKREKKVPL